LWFIHVWYSGILTNQGIPPPAPASGGLAKIIGIAFAIAIYFNEDSRSSFIKKKNEKKVDLKINIFYIN